MAQWRVEHSSSSHASLHLNEYLWYCFSIVFILLCLSTWKYFGESLEMKEQVCLSPGVVQEIKENPKQLHRKLISLQLFHLKICCLSYAHAILCMLPSWHTTNKKLPKRCSCGSDHYEGSLHHFLHYLHQCLLVTVIGNWKVAIFGYWVQNADMTWQQLPTPFCHQLWCSVAHL